MRSAKALTRLRGCVDSSVSSLLAFAKVPQFHALAHLKFIANNKVSRYTILDKIAIITNNTSRNCSPVGEFHGKSPSGIHYQDKYEPKTEKNVIIRAIVYSTCITRDFVLRPRSMDHEYDRQRAF